MTKLPSNSLPILQALLTKGAIRSKTLSMAIGYAIAEKLPQPSVPSESPASYLVGTFGVEVDGALNSIVNVVPIDFKVAGVYAGVFYSMFHALHFKKVNVFIETGNPLLDLLGLTSTISGEDLQIVQTDRNFKDYVNKMRTILTNFEV